MPIMEDVNAPWDNPTISTYLPGNFAIHANKWDMIKYADNSYELYDVSADEKEFVNLAGKAEYQSTLDSLKTFLPTSWFSMAADTVVDSVSEDFSTPEWNQEFLRLNPTYVKPAVGANFTLSSTTPYFGKYQFNGVVLGFSGTPNCITPGKTHGDQTEALSIRLKNNNAGFMEFPLVNNPGLMTLHVRSGNATTDTKIYLEAKDDDWTTLDSIVVHKTNNYNTTSIDEIITYPINLYGNIRLRVRCSSFFINIFEATIDQYNPSGLKTPKKPKAEPFKIVGRSVDRYQTWKRICL